MHAAGGTAVLSVLRSEVWDPARQGRAGALTIRKLSNPLASLEATRLMNTTGASPRPPANPSTGTASRHRGVALARHERSAVDPRRRGGAGRDADAHGWEDGCAVE